ncbi:Intradiol ring-cleavage dioxygenase [Xylariaceae sp. FL0255]|nr:Intradiol ring-cleavage dioxygenase [Xylariaceae sp. FL0255]
MFFTSSLVLGLAALTAAHPGHEEHERRQAIEARSTFAANKRALEACSNKLAERGHHVAAAGRRHVEVERLRAARGLPVKNTMAKRSNYIRDTPTVLATDHEGHLNGTLAMTDELYVFNSTQGTVLNPEGEVGPFYVLGEYVRSDIREDEPGVEIIIDAQFIDVSTCDPIEGGWFDIWSANSTGVYSGVQTDQNGNGNDASNLNNTALRGIQQTDGNGVVQFTSVFPGHYSGRTNHAHVVFHQTATELANGTLSGGTVSHIGQFFWDQSLIDEVEATYPYNTNTNPITTNAEDRVFGQQETTNTTSDPVFDYVFLGDDVTDGLFTWIVVGINTTASYTPTYSFELTSSGGEAVDGGGGAPGGTGGGPP